jgi:hypothetical protein
MHLLVKETLDVSKVETLRSKPLSFFVSWFSTFVKHNSSSVFYLIDHLLFTSHHQNKAAEHFK